MGLSAKQMYWFISGVFLMAGWIEANFDQQKSLYIYSNPPDAGDGQRYGCSHFIN